MRGEEGFPPSPLFICDSYSRHLRSATARASATKSILGWLGGLGGLAGGFIPLATIVALLTFVTHLYHLLL